jgi:hypothetical protein
MRFAGVLLFVATVVFAWLLAAELFTATWKRTLATAIVALQPKLGFMAGVVNPDIMLCALGAATLCLAVRTSLRGVTVGRAVGLGVVAGAAAFCHPRGLFVAPVAVLAILIGFVRFFPGWRASVLQLTACVAPAVLGLLAAVLWTRAHASGTAFGAGSPVAAFNARQFISYVWQFYLPKLSTMDNKVGPPYGYRQVFIESYFGSFGSLETNYRLWVYDTLQIGAAILALWVWTVAVRRPAAVLARWPAVVVMLAFAASLMVLLHIVSYSSLRGSVGNGGDPVITGRYLLPMTPILGCAIAWAIGALPPRARALGAGAMVGAFSMLAVGGVGIIAERFNG